MGLEFLGEKFKTADGSDVSAEEAVGGYKLILVLYTASWWPGCTPFKAGLKNAYEELNADGAKAVQVVVVSGDQNDDGWKSSMDGAPWVALPLGEKADIESKVPCTGYPTPGIVNGETGEVLNADAFGGDIKAKLQEHLWAWQ